MAELPYRIAHYPCIMTVQAGIVIDQAPPAVRGVTGRGDSAAAVLGSVEHVLPL
jgi:hypothetical protein